MSEKILFYNTDIQNIPNGIKYENISTIDNYNSNSIDSIIINDLIDYYDYGMEYELLKLVCDKLANKGTIEIQAPDVNELCIAVASAKIDNNLAKSILYNNKRSIHTIYDVEKMILNLDLQIVQKRYINIFEYYILAKKNEA